MQLAKKTLEVLKLFLSNPKFDEDRVDQLRLHGYVKCFHSFEGILLSNSIIIFIVSLAKKEKVWDVQNENNHSFFGLTLKLYNYGIIAFLKEFLNILV